MRLWFLRHRQVPTARVGDEGIHLRGVPAQDSSESPYTLHGAAENELQTWVAGQPLACGSEIRGCIDHVAGGQLAPALFEPSRRLGERLRVGEASPGSILLQLPEPDAGKYESEHGGNGHGEAAPAANAIALLQGAEADAHEAG